MNTEVCDLLYLAARVVNGIAPDLERVEKMNLEQVHALSAYHSLSAISGMALEKSYGGTLPDTPLFRTWAEEKNFSVYKCLLLDIEREDLFAFMEKNGIWHMSLKGILLKELYPEVGMRQMADNDILYDPIYQEEVHDWFVARGYDVESYRRGCHDVYSKQPVYSFEMHTALFNERIYPSLAAYYQNVKDKLLMTEGSQYEYHFSEEDFYVYMIAHAFKHYDNGGTGLRLLIDIYLYVQKMGDILEWSYIEKVLNSLGCAEFEKQCRELSIKLLSGQESELSETEEKMVNFLASSGTYGTMKNAVAGRIRKYRPDDQPMSKWEYYRRRLYPEQEWVERFYPLVGRHRWMKPFLMIYRVVKAVFISRNKLKAELKVVDAVESERKGR